LNKTFQRNIIESLTDNFDLQFITKKESKEKKAKPVKNQKRK